MDKFFKSIYKNRVNIKSICRKVCMFLIGLNLLQPIRVTFDSSGFLLNRFMLSENDFASMMSKTVLLMSIFSGGGAVLVSFYLVVLAPRMETTHFNNLIAIVTNWVVLLCDIFILFTFCMGGESGYLKVFYWTIIMASGVFGINQCIVLTIDPVNIPYFLLGVTFSSGQVMAYHAIFKGIMQSRGISQYNFGIVLGQLIISLVVSVIVAGLCTYGYGGKSLFVILGIDTIADFILDNSSKRLLTQYKENRKYKKYLNEEVTHKIKGLEYEIVLKFDSKTSYKTTNIIKGRRFTRISEYIDNKRSRKNKRNTNKYYRDDDYESDIEEGRSRKGSRSYSDERIDIEITVTNLKYENMMEGLEIYRHQVDKDVKLGRIKDCYSDIDLNLYHFKQADVYSKTNLYLINVVTTQFTSHDTAEYSDSDSFSNEDQVDHTGHRNPESHEVADREFYEEEDDHHSHSDKHDRHRDRDEDEREDRDYRDDQDRKKDRRHRDDRDHTESRRDREHHRDRRKNRDHDRHNREDDRHRGHHENRRENDNFKERSFKKRGELGVYEMDYYFFVVGSRMYQYKPSKKEWVHPVELLVSLIDLYRRSLEDLSRKSFQMFVNGFKSTKGLTDLTKKLFGSDKKDHSEYSEYSQSSSRSSLEDSHRSHHEGKGKGKELSKTQFEHDQGVRNKLIMLFLNNKLRYALLGSIYPLSLNLLTIIFLFASIPMMGFFDNVNSPLANRADMVVKLVLLFPAVSIFCFCTLKFLEEFTLQNNWTGRCKSFFASLVAYLIACLIAFIVSRNANEQDLANNNAFIVIMTLVIAVTFHVNIICSLIGLMFQRSGKRDTLTLNYLENNLKTNSQLMSFNLLIFHGIRLVYLGIYRKYNNKLFKILYWVV